MGEAAVAKAGPVRPKRRSIPSTYDSRMDGPAFHVSTFVNGRAVTFMEPIADPFHRTSVVIGWRDLLRGLRRRHVEVEVSVGARPSVVEDVMELDGNYLGQNCTRRDAFNMRLRNAMTASGADDSGSGGDA